jgi:hypothetical protein
VRRTVLAVGALCLLAGCGGGGSPSTPTAAATPSPTPTVSSAVVVLDSSNFDALVLGATKPVLVEFHSPT